MLCSHCDTMASSTPTSPQPEDTKPTPDDSDIDEQDTMPTDDSGDESLPHPHVTRRDDLPRSLLDMHAQMELLKRCVALSEAGGTTQTCTFHAKVDEHIAGIMRSANSFFARELPPSLGCHVTFTDDKCGTASLSVHNNQNIVMPAHDDDDDEMAPVTPPRKRRKIMHATRL